MSYVLSFRSSEPILVGPDSTFEVEFVFLEVFDFDFEGLVEESESELESKPLEDEGEGDGLAGVAVVVVVECFGRVRWTPLRCLGFTCAIKEIK